MRVASDRRASDVTLVYSFGATSASESSHQECRLMEISTRLRARRLKWAYCLVAILFVLQRSTEAARDRTPPTVTLTAPSSGTSVSGSIVVSAAASDNVGVVGVEFRIDGALLGTEDTASPYSVSWNSATATNGSHSLTAVARDAAGNRRTSTAVSITVANAASDATPPTVSISAPAGGTSVSGAVNVTATATDNVGVAGVQFKLDGNNLGPEDTTAPYSQSWVTTGSSDLVVGAVKLIAWPVTISA